MPAVVAELIAAPVADIYAVAACFNSDNLANGTTEIHSTSVTILNYSCFVTMARAALTRAQQIKQMLVATNSLLTAAIKLQLLT